MSDLRPGMMVNSNVRLLRPLGEGGMGRVWIADHLSLHTQVVVKFMAVDLADSPSAIARFSREAAAASQVKSPNVVQVHDYGVGEDGAPFIVMELLEGRDLEQHLRVHGKLEPREVAAIVAQLSRALSKAHALGIVHRDIKPSNVFLLDAGGDELFVKLLDFGVAKAPAAFIGATSTHTGALVGSPSYMSPEQVVGSKEIDFRSDLWSLGIVAFEALTGSKPFVAGTLFALAIKIHQEALPVPSVANPALDPAVDVWFARACARDPKDRFSSAKELALALERAIHGEARASRLPSPPPMRPLEPALTTGDESTRVAAAEGQVKTDAGVGVPTGDATKRASRGRARRIGGLAAAVVGVALLASWFGSHRGPASDPQAPASGRALVSTPDLPNIETHPTPASTLPAESESGAPLPSVSAPPLSSVGPAPPKPTNPAKPRAPGPAASASAGAPTPTTRMPPGSPPATAAPGPPANSVRNPLQIELQ